MKFFLKWFSYLWLTIWMVSTTIIIAPQIGIPSDTISVGTYLMAAFYALCFSLVPFVISLICYTKRWFIWVVVALIVILPFVAIYNSDHIATTYEWKERVGAIASDGWVSHSTGSGATSHHGGVREWIYEHRSRPLSEPEIKVWKAQFIWLPYYASFILALQLAIALYWRREDVEKKMKN